MQYTVYLLSAPTPSTQQIQVLESTATAPGGGYNSIGTFYHGLNGVDDALDNWGSSINHTIYTHVQELLDKAGIEDCPHDNILIFTP